MKRRKLKLCRRCHHPVRRETTKPLKREYPFYCPTCDENLYSMEVFKSQKKGKSKGAAMTYYALLCLETKDNEEIDPTYTRAHLNVSECYPSADDGAKWDDPADPATLKAVTTDRQ